MKKEPVIHGFKGFHKDFKCNGKQYAENETATFDGNPVICSKGLHFCEYPLDVLAYYPAGISRFAPVEGSGKVDKKTGEGEDTKVCCTTLKIGAEITLHKLIDAGVEFIFERTKKVETKNNNANKKQCGNETNGGTASNSGYSGAASNSGDSGAASNSGDSGAASNSGYGGTASNSGYRGAASNSGDSGAASNSGDSGAASNSGYRGAASNSGDSGAASNSGYRGAASNSGYRGAASNSGYRGAASNSGDSGAASNSGDSGAAFTNGSYSSTETNAKDSVAVAVGYSNKVKGNLASWIVVAERNNDYEILDIQAVKVDGKKIKADTFYKLENGKLIIA